MSAWITSKSANLLFAAAMVFFSAPIGLAATRLPLPRPDHPVRPQPGTEGGGAARNGAFGTVMTSVLDFGAKCDGRTDDAAAIQAAVARAAPGTVIFPAGRTCVLSLPLVIPGGATLDLNTATLHFTGDGGGPCSGGVHGEIQEFQQTRLDFNTILKNGQVNTSNPQTGCLVNIGVRTGFVNYFIVRNIVFRGADDGTIGIYINNAGNFEILNNVFPGHIQESIDAPQKDGRQNNFEIAGNIFAGPMTPSRYQVYFDNAQSGRIDGNNFEVGPDGLWLGPAVYDTAVRGNWLGDARDPGTWIMAGGLATQIHSNWVYGVRGTTGIALTGIAEEARGNYISHVDTGIDVSPRGDAEITGNAIEDFYRNGIVLRGPGCAIEANSLASAAAQAQGIVLGASEERVGPDRFQLSGEGSSALRCDSRHNWIFEDPADIPAECGRGVHSAP